MEKKNKFCQSCGMPMKKDPKGGSTNADGSPNTTYCSYCYENGEFTQKNMTVIEMQELVKGHLKKIGFPGFLASLFTKNIPKLKRWQQK